MENIDNYIQYLVHVDIQNTDSRHSLLKTATLTERECKESCSLHAVQISNTNATISKMEIFKHDFNTTLLKVSTCANTINWKLIVYDLD